VRTAGAGPRIVPGLWLGHDGNRNSALNHPAFTNLIITYNNAADAPSLLGQLRLYVPDSQTILIDNASSDGTASVVHDDFPEVQLVRNPSNVGYARAVNQGFALSTSEFVFLLNPDIRISSSVVFQELQRCLLDETHVAVAGPLQFKEDGPRSHLNFTWSYWTPRAFRVYLSYRMHRGRDFIEPIGVTFLNAGCLFIRRSAFDAVGRLNEKYFLYGEEPDLFLKLKRQGYECRLLPGVSVVHSRERSLATVHPVQRLRFKLRGGWNIADALWTGFSRIVADRIRRSPRG
jgi:N-acetylglucosaminyl-diphospho-decaprenol L-rhamnosyltransferase